MLTTDQAQRLLTWADTAHYLEDLPDADLADLLEQTVWTTLPLMTPASDLVSEVLDRLRGIQRRVGTPLGKE